PSPAPRRRETSAWPTERVPPIARRTSFAMSRAEREGVPLPINSARSSSSDSDDAPRATRRSRGRVDSGHSRMGTHARYRTGLDTHSYEDSQVSHAGPRNNRGSELSAFNKA